MDKIISNSEYLKEQKNNILIDYKSYVAYCQQYKQANGKQKNFVSISKQLNNIIVACQNERVSNNDIINLKSACYFLLKNEKDIDKIKAMNGFSFKKTLVDVYNKTQKVGVISVDNNDGTTTKKLDLIGRTGYATISTMLLLLLSNSQTFSKPPKKEKPKKTIKK